jgi:hypothetical protein
VRLFLSRPEEEKTPPPGEERVCGAAGKPKTGSLARHLPAFLKFGGKDDRPPPPIIEMVPVASPSHSTYQFPSRYAVMNDIEGRMS